MSGKAEQQRHHRSRRLELARSGRRARGDENYEIAVRIGSAQNDLDREFVRELLDDPHHNFEGTRRRLADLLLWLEGHGARTLFKGQRIWLTEVRRMLRINARELAETGKITPFVPDPTQRKRSTRYQVPRRAPLPDWMNNPALLPKRPPGAPQQ